MSAHGRSLIVTLAVWAALSAPAAAWWDTQIQVVRQAPTVRNVQAETCKGVPASAVAADDKAWGGRCVILKPGGAALTFEQDFEVSHYVVHVICRAGRGAAKGAARTTAIVLSLRVTNLADGAKRQWQQRITYMADRYEDGGHLYFPVYKAGRYRIEVSSAATSQADLRVDFLALKDLFAELPKTGEKKGQNLLTPEEISAIRSLAKSRQLAVGLRKKYAAVLRQGPEFQQWKRKRFGQVWASKPIRNRHFKQQGTRSRYRALEKLLTTTADAYLRTGNEAAGWEGVCALIAFADLYPDVDFQTQNSNFSAAPFGMNPLGKFLYSGHAWGLAERLLIAYDRLFQIISKDDALPALVGEKIPWVKTNADVIKLLDTNLLQHVRDCVDRQVIRSGEGDSEKVCVLAGLVQGPGKAGDWILKLPFTRCHLRMINRGGLQDHFISSTTSDGCAYIGSIEYSKARPKVAAAIVEYIRRYKALGGKPLFDLDDATQFPNVLNGPDFNLNRIVAGGFTPRIGDWGTVSDPPNQTENEIYRQLYTYGFIRTGDPRYAYWLNKWGRQSESNAAWRRVVKAAGKVGRSTFLDNRTRAMPGFGMAVLEAGLAGNKLYDRTAAILRTGVGQGHGHNDMLSLLVYGKGVRAMVNNGRRGGRGNSRRGRWHNSLEIDEKEFMPKKFNSSGVGWIETVNDLGGDLGYTRGAARSPSHSYVKTYRRDVAMIPTGPYDAFVFDVFRVDGGKVHTWTCAGPVSDSGGVSFNVRTTASKLPNDLSGDIARARTAAEGTRLEDRKGFHLVDRYLPGRRNRQWADCSDTTRITWQVSPSVLRRYYGRTGWPAGDKKTSVQVRAWRLNTAGQTLLTGWGGFADFAIKNAPTRNFVYTRAESKTSGLQGAYPTVSEVYLNDKPLLKSVETLETSGGAKGALAPVVVKIVSHAGQETLAMLNGRAGGPVTAPGLKADGEFACVSRDAKGRYTRVALVGGTMLECDDVVIRTERAGYSAKVVSLDVPGNSVLVDATWPAKLLDGENFLLRRANVDHNVNFVVKRVRPGRGKSTLQLRGGIKVFQSAITHFDGARGEIVTDMPFVLQESDPSYYDNMTVLNERHEVLGTAEFRTGDRFMFMGKPYHQFWRQRIKGLKDIPDADGDGKRTLRMVATSRTRRVLPTPGLLEAGETMATLEVTRVSDDGLMMWFKDPPQVYTDSSGTAHRHWPYQDQELITEDGKRVLQANYPGDEVNLAVKGRKLTRKDFPDADGDGRRAVSLSHIAAGDIFETPSTVSLVRDGNGALRLRANCAVTLTFPKEKQVTIERTIGGKTTRKTVSGTFTLSAADLADAQVRLITGDAGK